MSFDFTRDDPHPVDAADDSSSESDAPSLAARQAMLRLCLTTGVGPRLRQALMEHFGSAEAVLRAAPSEWRAVPGIGPKLCKALAEAHHIDAAAELDTCRQRGIQVLLEGDEAYPRPLREICDPPGVLFVRGELRASDELSIAIVGSRHATRYGLMVATRLAASLSRAGLTIISGLARGIDAAAHRGALEAGGRTLAVLGCGLDRMYPPEHVGLADEVAAQGALLTEMPLGSRPASGAFPQRNRLISGMTLGTIVVEAATRSGALITARHAMEQGREVFAVPGQIDNPLAHGCHQLIRDGARLVESADDVLEELGPLIDSTPQADGRIIRHPGELLLNELEQKVLDAIETQPTPIDELIRATGLATPQVLATISALEIRRLVHRISGGTVVRN